MEAKQITVVAVFDKAGNICSFVTHCEKTRQPVVYNSDKAAVEDILSLFKDMSGDKDIMKAPVKTP